MIQAKSLLFSLLFVMAGTLCAYAQLTLRPLTGGTHHRVLDVEDTISLPFWDDFSDSGTTLDSSKWRGIDARVSRTLGIRPPTTGVVVFDGLTSLGTPHNPNTQFVGPADSLRSRYIDLSGIAESRKATVWLSFFWQIKGNGEIPDTQDSLRLQFFTEEGQWSTVWSITGGLDNQKDDFEQVLIQLNRQEYFHAGFRFRFQSFNRLTGPFDTFLIDYVYLNEGRSILDNVYFDRALTGLPSYSLNGYSAVPIKQFRSNPSSFITPPFVGFYNLDNQLQPIAYSAYISLQQSGEIIEMLNNQTVVNPVPLGLERRVFTANAPNPDQWPLEEDSLYLNTTFFITSGDDIRQGIDYRVNDTIHSTFVLDDYFAYDDGTAEFAAGINQSRGQLAIQYYAPTSDFLTGVDIHFPQIFPLSNGQPIELLIMKDLTSEIGTLLAKQSFTAQFGAQIDDFVSYTFESPVLVSDTFYIGFQQFTDNFIGIGLDKNNDTGTKIFYNVGGEWQQNISVDGSLMIRPKFERISPTVTAIDHNLRDKVNVYPNPTSGWLHIEADGLDGLALLNIAGQELAVLPHPKNQETLSLSGLPAGIYLLRLTLGQQQVIRKIILR